MLKSHIPKAQLTESIAFIRSKTALKPKIGIILGSGLGDFADNLKNQISIKTKIIPHYPASTIEGHKGNLVFGNLLGIPVVAFQGRVHFYETGSLKTILYPIYVASHLGVKILIITNAAGGINRQFTAGDLMLITDQINLTFMNPIGHLRLKTKNKHLYDRKLLQLAINAANENKIPIKQGVYCGVKGPSYETAAEIEMIRRLGGDAVGMSTVNEVSLAHALGIRLLGISCITNLATGILETKLSHDEVTQVADRVKSTFSVFLQGIIKNIKRVIFRR